MRETDEYGEWEIKENAKILIAPTAKWYAENVSVAKIERDFKKELSEATDNAAKIAVIAKYLGLQ